MPAKPTIRREHPPDFPAVRAVHEEAFDRAEEGALVDAIRTACPQASGWVATIGEEITGHVFFSPVKISDDRGTITGMGLGPMAVLPRRQRQGIGSALVRRGIESLREDRCPFIVVLGHPDYYPRFGFRPALERGLACQWEGVPAEAFMILVLDESRMQGVSGTATYRDEFGSVE